MAGLKHSVFEYELVAGGGTTTLPSSAPYTAIRLYTSGAVVLAANFVANTSGTFRQGEEITVYCDLDGVDLNGNTVTILGESISQAVLTNCNFMVKAYYDGSKLITNVIPSASDSGYIVTANLADDAITTAKIADDAVTNDLLANITRGSIKVGGAANAPTDLAALTSAQLVAGNGTDVISAPMTGDVTLTHSAGNLVAAIGAGKVTPTMLSFTLASELTTSLSVTSAQILALNTTPLTLVAAAGANKIIVPKHCIVKYSYSAAAYATNTTLELIHSGGTISMMEDTTALIGTVSKNIQMKHTATGAAAGATHALANADLQVKVRTGDPTAGSGTIKVFLTYYIQDIS